MKLILVLSVFLCAILLVNGRTSEILKVKLRHGGTLVGRYLSTFKGKGIRGFLGIPYAKPPINDLRFKEPIPFGAWKGERDATKDSSICIQRDPFRRDIEIEGSEDCLYLNVYTPIRDEKKAKPLPVMVFFHGGGWQCGSGISMFYGPDFIMEHENIIYIGANFRLGPLGFMSTGTKDCPGNNGLKDQVQVLRWIKENVGAFGGDPNKVTVFGESAGGASGTYHMMSPLSKGLFNQVISQSGANFNPWAQPAHKGVAEKRAAKLGEMMGCDNKNGADWGTMIDCLRKVPAENITAAFYDFFAWDTDPMIPFPPVVEPDLPGAFISVHPRDVKQPHGLSIKWMAGLTSDEGAMKSAPLINLKELTNDLNINWDHALETSLYYDHHDYNSKQKITNRINEFYFKNRKLEPATHQNLTNLYTDSWFLHGMDEYFRIRFSDENKSKRGPTYVYLFNHKASASFTEIFKGGRENYFGVSHAEELQFLFPIAQWLFVSAVPTEDDLKIRDTLTEMWTNFANYGHPTPDGTKLAKWDEATSYPVQYLRIGNKDQESNELIKMEKGLLQERADFWYEIGAHLPAKDGGKDEL